MIKSEAQRQREMRDAQNEWWGKLTDAEKSKATGMALDQATGWWAVADVDSRERLMRAYIAQTENAAPAEATETTEEKVDETKVEETEAETTTEQTEATAEATGDANPTEENAAPAEAAPAEKAETPAAKKGGKKTSKK